MTSLYGLLAFDMGLVLKILPFVGIAILVLAFAIGASKGFRNVKKGGLMWLLAGGGFAFLYSLLGENNLLGGILGSGALASYANAIWAFVLVVACIAAALAIAALLSVLFRYIPADEEEEEEEFALKELPHVANDAQHPMNKQRKVVRKRRRKKRHRSETSILVRITGGFVCLLNLLAILVIIAAFVLIVLQNSKYASALNAVYSVSIIQSILGFAEKYIFDIVTVGIVMLVAHKGFKTGLARTAKNFFRRVGMLAGLVAGFVLPFLAFFNELSFVQTLFGTIKGFLPAWGMISDVLARIIMGAGLAIILVIVMAILNWLLRKLTYSVEDTEILQKIDGGLAAILYLVLGAVVCVVFWLVIFLLNRYGILAVEEKLMAIPSFAKECFLVAKNLFDLVAAKLPFAI